MTGGPRKWEKNSVKTESFIVNWYRQCTAWFLLIYGQCPCEVGFEVQPFIDRIVVHEVEFGAHGPTDITVLLS